MRNSKSCSSTRRQAAKGKGKNLGGLLVKTATQRARKRGCAEFGLYRREATEQNRPLYEKYGFASGASYSCDELATGPPRDLT
jgi:ribosomal protein S18 acetylase RimI-like enzyme